MLFYRTKNQEWENMLKDMDFCHSPEWKFLDTATKARLDVLKPATKKVAHKAAEATGEFIGNKITEKIVKSD